MYHTDPTYLCFYLLNDHHQFIRTRLLQNVTDIPKYVYNNFTVKATLKNIYYTSEYDGKIYVYMYRQDIGLPVAVAKM